MHHTVYVCFKMTTLLIFRGIQKLILFSVEEEKWLRNDDGLFLGGERRQRRMVTLKYVLKIFSHTTVWRERESEWKNGRWKHVNVVIINLKTNIRKGTSFRVGTWNQQQELGTANCCFMFSERAREGRQPASQVA